MLFFVRQSLLLISDLQVNPVYICPNPDVASYDSDGELLEEDRAVFKNNNHTSSPLATTT